MLRPSPRPTPLPVCLPSIPPRLRDIPQWVLWRYEWRHDKWTKVPYPPHGQGRAKSTDPATWSTFEQVWRAYTKDGEGDGVGFVVTEEIAVVGIDLDHCVTADTGDIEPWALAIVRRIDSYTEISVSGTGIRIFSQGDLPPHGRKKGPIEMYTAGRFLTVTGCHLQDTPTTIEPRQAHIHALHAEVFADRLTPPQSSPHISHGAGPSLSDDDLLARALAARNASKFAALWSGDTSGQDDDDSRADLALCCELAFWTEDKTQMDRLFRRSALYRSKWERDDYRNATIAKALAVTTEHWTPRPVTSTRHSTLVDHDPWDGRRTLPLKPYTGLRLRKVVRRGQ
jgi:putative DNA primase/helicase